MGNISNRMSVIHLPLVTFHRPAPALGVETIAPASQVERMTAHDGNDGRSVEA